MKIRFRNLSSSFDSFSVDIFSISSTAEGQGISFEDLNALRITSLMKVATSFNLTSEAAKYDAATAFETDVSELKNSQNEMQSFHNTFEDEINCKILSSFSIFFINFSERKCGLE